MPGEPENHVPGETCVFRKMNRFGACHWCESGLRVLLSYVYCQCPDGEKAYRDAIVAMQAESRRETNSIRIHIWEHYSGIPERFKPFELGPPLSSRLVSYLTRHDKEVPVSWYLHGEVGRGKTGAAVGYVRQWVFTADPDEYPLPVLFTSVPDLLEEIRGSFDHERGEPDAFDIIAKYRRAELLILDDLGTEHLGTGWVESELYTLISARSANPRVATVFTSNHSPEETEQRIGPRIMDRIREVCPGRVKRLVGPNLRRPANVQPLDKEGE